MKIQLSIVLFLYTFTFTQSARATEVKKQQAKPKALSLPILPVAEPKKTKPIELGPFDTQDGFGDTALHVASCHGYLPVVELLLNSKANPNVANSARVTPVVEAVRANYRAIVLLLIKHKADIDGTYGINALHEACTCNPAMARTLLENKANVNAVDGSLNHGLHFAATNGQHDVVKILLEHRATPRPLNADGHNPFFYATTSPTKMALISPTVSPVKSPTKSDA